MNTRAAFVAIVGRPNVGKSSVLNSIIGRKVAIVSNKPQTTRNRIMGVYTRENIQLVFVDTPGMHRPRTRLGDFMVQSIQEAVAGVDAAVMVVEPVATIRDSERELLDQLAQHRLPTLLVINKIDTLEDKNLLLTCMDFWRSVFDFHAIIPTSAVTGDGIDVLIEELKGFTIESPHFFPPHVVSDQPERVLASEILREKMLMNLRDEIPHGIAVVVEKMAERNTQSGPILDIDAYIYCEKTSHKGIIIGKQGAMLKTIASSARADMEQVFGVKVNLQCWVKVKEDWRNRQNLLNSFGYFS